MKKVLLVLLIGFLSCSEVQQIEPELEIEQNCFSIISLSTGSTGRAIVCDENAFIINVVRREVYLAGQPSNYDKIEICVTNPDIDFYDLKLGQTLCDLSVLK
tara:strand:- start:295 stop:600 length:306 start_codon:yes stop_codon:yes gene_type:complete